MLTQSKEDGEGGRIPIACSVRVFDSSVARLIISASYVSFVVGDAEWGATGTACRPQDYQQGKEGEEVITKQGIWYSHSCPSSPSIILLRAWRFL